jgi:hypothetical protein
MAKIVAGMASSHASALSGPAVWEKSRERNRLMYKKRFGVEPPVHPKIGEESMGERQLRYQRVRDGLNFLRDELQRKKPDALILVGDDQHEHFKDDNVPQIAIYLGEEVFATERQGDGRQRGPRYSCHSELAHNLLQGLIDRGFDVSFCRSFPNSELLAHAHGPILRTVMPAANIPVVLLFVNAIHIPAPSPRRCYRLGQAIRETVEGWPTGERVAVYASGGLSHFTAGYPWGAYEGPFFYGCISEEFDRKTLESMAHGEGHKLAELTSQDLLQNGDIEMRSWIVLAGAMGKVPARVLAYEPLYSGYLGMAVSYWEAEDRARENQGSG